MDIAIVGSRKYTHPDEVRALVRVIRQNEPDAVIISGGAVGVDATAENEALHQGLGVCSFRVYSIKRDDGEEWGIEEHRMGNQKPYVRKMIEHPTFASYVDGLFYRNTLIVDYAERVVAFWDEWSSGTKFTIGYAKDRGKRVTIYTPLSPFEAAA